MRKPDFDVGLVQPATDLIPDVTRFSMNARGACEAAQADRRAVQHARRGLDSDDFSQLWRSAHRRRSADICFWFIGIFKELWRLKLPDGPATKPRPRSGQNASLFEKGSGGQLGRLSAIYSFSKKLIHR